MQPDNIVISHHDAVSCALGYCDPIVIEAPDENSGFVIEYLDKAPTKFIVRGYLFSGGAPLSNTNFPVAFEPASPFDKGQNDYLYIGVRINETTVAITDWTLRGGEFSDIIKGVAPAQFRYLSPKFQYISKDGLGFAQIQPKLKLKIEDFWLYKASGSSKFNTAKLSKVSKLPIP